MGLKEDILFLEMVLSLLGGGAAELRWAGGAQRPVGRGKEPKNTGARSARVRTRGQNPLVQIYLSKIKKNHRERMSISSWFFA